MKIYAACLASYNAGTYHGAWIEIESGATSDTILAEIDKMLKASPTPGAEEYAIHDYEGVPQSLMTAWGEHPDLDEVASAAEALLDSGEVFEAALSYSGHVGEALEACRNQQYVDCGESPEEIVEKWFEDTGTLEEVPERLRCYIDFKAYARDLRLSGEWFFELVNGTYYAFSTI